MLEQSWQVRLQEEFTKDYFSGLVSFLEEEKKSGFDIFPPEHLIFNAFLHTPFDQVKVVILGQDPYHGPGQAMGLSFSVPDEITIPPSLRNIYKEIVTNTTEGPDQHMQGKYLSGDLTRRADQGVLLLNSILTVRAEEPASHRKQGWETFTDTVISYLSHEREGIVFLLWGNYSKQKKELIDTTKHHVLESVHPSPLSASRGWFGCGHFEETNRLLLETGKEPIVR